MIIHRLQETPFTNISEVEQCLLARLPTAAQKSFLTPSRPEELGEESHGLSFDLLTQAAEIIRKAGTDKKKILIFGDYDCDGVTSTAILWETLHELGIESRPFLPHREKNGYGLSVSVLEEIWSEYQPELLITVDNGIVANAAFAWLKDRGVQTILTDHHQLNGDVPGADVVLHSTRLSGAGIAWYLAYTLSPELAQQELDFAVLGTLADQVPLIHANRSLAVHGLQALRDTKRPSLVTMAKNAKLTLSKADESTVHYGFAPRINALGRISHALEALRALLSRKPERMQQLLTRMEEVNSQRQSLTNDAYTSLSANMVSGENDAVVIVAGEYAEGIVGLLASKLVDRYHKPAIVITTSSDFPKASCRSIDGVSIIDILRSLPADLFSALGGHPGAAGFSLADANTSGFVSAAVAKFNAAVTEELLVPKLEVLGTLDWKLLSPPLVQTLNKFAPFGNGNESPVFSLGAVVVNDVQAVGKAAAHHRVTLQNPETKQSVVAICFNSERRQIHCAEITEPFVRVKASTFRPGTIDIEIVAALTDFVSE